jgi:hypothetical protein
MAEMTVADGSEIPMWAVYAFALSFLLFFVGGLISYWLVVLGGLLAILVGFMTYSSQGRGGAGGRGFGMPALHRELAKTHCGQCGAPMRV